MTKQKKTFQKFKQTCFETSILKMFDTKKSKKIETNVFDITIKTCFNQKHNDA